jgi:hypothetical protein
MEFLARELSGDTVSDKDRAKRTGNVNKALSAEERAAAAVVRAENMDKFMKASGIAIGGWFGTPLGDSSSSFGGGGSLELRLGPYFGIQSGLNYVGGLQIPILARGGYTLLGFLPVAAILGVGINLNSAAPINFIAGADVGITLWNILLTVGVQFNGTFDKPAGLWSVGVNYFIPFRRK